MYSLSGRLRRVFAVAAVVFLASLSQAYSEDDILDYDCLTFENALGDGKYGVGEVATFSETRVEFLPFFWLGGDVANRGIAFINEEYRLWTNNINVAFNLPIGVRQLSLDYGSFGGNINIRANFEFLNTHPGYSLMDVNGELGDTRVEIANERCSRGGCIGTLTVVGSDIHDFMIGGQEFYVDNVCIKTAGKSLLIDQALETLDRLVEDPDMRLVVKKLVDIRKETR